MSKLERLNDHVYTVHQPLNVFGMPLGTRATIVVLPDNEVVIISPVVFDDALASEIDALGRVGTIIAPNLFHHLFFNAACERWPEARALIPPGLNKKVSIVEGATKLSESGAINDLLFWRRIEGMPMVREHYFYYPEAKTLIITDLAFHFPDPGTFLFRLYLGAQGLKGSFGPTALFRFAIKDKGAFKESLLPIRDYHFESIALPHGEVISEKGKEIFEKAFASYLK